jgi:hypothetical protein
MRDAGETLMAAYKQDTHTKVIIDPLTGQTRCWDALEILDLGC